MTIENSPAGALRAAILKALHSGPALTVDICDKLGVPHADVVGEVRRMTSAGLVRARPWNPATPAERLALVAFRAARIQPVLIVTALGGAP